MIDNKIWKDWIDAHNFNCILIRKKRKESRDKIQTRINIAALLINATAMILVLIAVNI